MPSWLANQQDFELWMIIPLLKFCILNNISTINTAVDNSAAIFSVLNFKSPTFGVNRIKILKKISKLLASRKFMGLTGWVPTLLNPADELTHFPVSEWANCNEHLLAQKCTTFVTNPALWHDKKELLPSA
jgi:hypothetical protein